MRTGKLDVQAMKVARDIADGRDVAVYYAGDFNALAKKIKFILESARVPYRDKGLMIFTDDGSCEFMKLC